MIDINPQYTAYRPALRVSAKLTVFSIKKEKKNWPAVGLAFGVSVCVIYVDVLKFSRGALQSKFCDNEVFYAGIFTSYDQCATFCEC